jgi:hypothetical protein
VARYFQKKFGKAEVRKNEKLYAQNVAAREVTRTECHKLEPEKFGYLCYDCAYRFS